MGKINEDIISASTFTPSNYVGTLGWGGKKPGKWYDTIMAIRKRNKPVLLKGEKPGKNGKYIWGNVGITPVTL